MLASCSVTSPPSVEETLEETLRSVQGLWRGEGKDSSSGNQVILEFSLIEQANNQVQGTGTMRESSTATPVPITVTGTFHRPTLVLTFTGMGYEARSVVGIYRADYTTVAGLFASLQLTSEGVRTEHPDAASRDAVESQTIATDGQVIKKLRHDRHDDRRQLADDRVVEATVCHARSIPKRSPRGVPRLEQRCCFSGLRAADRDDTRQFPRAAAGLRRVQEPPEAT